MNIATNGPGEGTIQVILPLLGVWLLVSIVLGGCATLHGQKATSKDLEETVDAFNTAFRWGDYKTASKFILPTDQDTFWEDTETLSRTTRITKLETRAVRMEGFTGLAQVVCTYYRLDDPSFKTKMLHQKWQYDEELRSWHLVDPEIYKLLP